MVKKKDIQQAVNQDMKDRNLNGSLEPKTQGKEKQKSRKSYKCDMVTIRFDEGEYEELKKIALEQGTTGASLVRKAVKEIIKRGF